MNLKPCPHRSVDNDGHILCSQIKSGDRLVSPSTCLACPIAQIDCVHLRASLKHQPRTPLLVRWGNGKSAIWDEPVPPLALERAACSAKTTPIASPRDCRGCALRQPLISPASIAAMPHRAAPPALQPTPRLGAASVVAGAGVVARKVLLLSEWLEQKNARARQEERFGTLPLIPGIRPAHAFAEEKKAGWTD